MVQVLLVLAVLATQALALFPCANLEASGKFYNLSSLDFTFDYSEVKNTPPSITNFTVYVNPCGAISTEPACPPDAQVCAVQRISIGDESFVSQVMPFACQDSYDTKFDVSAHPRGLKGVVLSYSGSQWGTTELSAEISYVCGTTFSMRNSWYQDDYLSLEFSTPAACETLDSPGTSPTKPPKPSPSNPSHTNPPQKNPDTEPKKGGWGFFTWVGFLLLVAFIGYAGFTLWINYQESGRSPRLEEWADVLRDLPYLIRDFVRKIVGTFGTRGGYSAI